MSARFAAAALIAASTALAQFPQGGQQPESVRQAQQLLRDGKYAEAEAAYRKAVADAPDSPQVNNAAGVAFDLMGKSAEARKFFQTAIDHAATPAAKANAERAMAMSYAFDGDCKNTVKYEQMVIDYWTSSNSPEAAYQAGEMADEAGRVCIDAGDLDTAEKYYKIGHEEGLKEQNIDPDRAKLWNYRYEHALARLAARRGDKAEAEKHVAAAKAILESMDGLKQQQQAFFPYLTGYVAFYTGDYRKALDDFQKANQNDWFIQCMIGETYEKLGDKEKAMEYYRKASKASAHNPPAAYAKRFTRSRV
jgi:tetratricopeptide (TPR) repeat protein